MKFKSENDQEKYVQEMLGCISNTKSVLEEVENQLANTSDPAQIIATLNFFQDCMYVISSIGEYSVSNHTELSDSTPSYTELRDAMNIYQSVYAEEFEKSDLPHSPRFHELWEHYLDRVEKANSTNRSKK